MATHHISRFSGLWTDPNPHADVPEGALQEATNVVIRRPGVVEPRPGFKSNVTAEDPPPAGQTVRSLHPFDGNVYGFSRSGAGDWRMDKVAGFVQVTTSDNMTPPNENDIETKSASAKQNLYFTSEKAIQLIESNSDTAAARAGMPAGIPAQSHPNTGHSTTTPTWLATGKWVMYRCVWYRVHASGQKIFGPPSGRFIFKNESGASRSYQVTLPTPQGVVAGDHVQLYRSTTETVGVEPNDELQLVADHELTSGEASAGSATIHDFVAEEDRGAVIYTAPGQEGIARQNESPPIADDVAWFKRSMFYARTKGRQRVEMQLLRSDDTTDDDGKVYAYTEADVSLTDGSNTFTADPVDGWEIGQYVTDQSAGPTLGLGKIPALTTITNIVGSAPATITMSASATGTTTTTAYVHDWIEIDDTVFFAHESSTSHAFRTFRVMADARETVQNLAHAVGRGMSTHYIVQQNVGETAGGIFFIESVDKDASQFFVNGNKATAWAPELSQSASDVGSKQDDLDNRLMWSKGDQPESVPIANTLDIGDSRKRILRIVPTMDALFIFKQDGVWRLTGEGERSGWRLDEFAPDLHLLDPEAVTTLDDVIYAWTDRGVARISNAGVAILSAPINRDGVDTDLHQGTSALAIYPSNSQGVWMSAWPTEREIWFSYDTAGDTGEGTAIYVWNESTQSWTKQDLQTMAGVYNPAEDRMWVGESTYTVLISKLRSDANQASDTEYAVTVNSVTTTTVTIAGGSGWTPAVGDALEDSAGAFHIVTAITSATVFTVDGSATVATGAGTGLAGFECVVELRPQALGMPSILKHFGEGAWTMDAAGKLSRLTFGYQNDTIPTGGSQAISRAQPANDTTRKERYTVDREYQLGTVLRPKLTIKNAASRWRLSGASITFEPQSEASVV